jgi:hypothetical protein
MKIIINKVIGKVFQLEESFRAAEMKLVLFLAGEGKHAGDVTLIQRGEDGEPLRIFRTGCYSR